MEFRIDYLAYKAYQILSLIYDTLCKKRHKKKYPLGGESTKTDFNIFILLKKIVEQTHNASKSKITLLVHWEK